MQDRFTAPETSWESAVAQIGEKLGSGFPTRSDFAKYQLVPHLLSDSNALDRLHGAPHMTRTLVLVDQLGRLLGYDFDLEPVRWAAITHDIGRGLNEQEVKRLYSRHNNGFVPSSSRLIDGKGNNKYHGSLSMFWIKDNLNETMNYYVSTVTQILCAEHEFSSSDNIWAPREIEMMPFSFRAMWQSLALLKETDRLERLRLDDLDPNRLQFDVSRGLLVPVARKLITLTDNQDYVTPSEAFNGVLDAAGKMGIIR